jgi:hypothetical protein
MAMPVVTPNRRWPTRLAAEQACLHILRNSGYAVGARVTDASDIDVLTEILAIHPHAAEKAGPGVDHFSVEQMSGTPGQSVSADSMGFVIHHVDGGRVDFSYVEAIYPSDQKRRVTAALKSSVDDLRLGFRDARFAGGGAVSDDSGVAFGSRAEASVVYNNPSFSQLAYRFAESEGGWNAIDVESGGSSLQIGDVIVDSAVRQRWRDFFQAHARPTLATRSEGARRRRVDETAWTP